MLMGMDLAILVQLSGPWFVTFVEINMVLFQLSEKLSVTAQIDEEGVHAAAIAGFKLIVCNRPDGEVADQPTAAQVAQMVSSHNLLFMHQPVISGHIGTAEALRFRQILEMTPGPVLAYCRSGTRCSILWALSESGRQDPEAILQSTANAGFNLEILRLRLQPVT